MDVNPQFFNVDFDNLSGRTDPPFNTGTSPENPRGNTSGGFPSDGRDVPDFSSFSGTYGETPASERKDQGSVITDQDEWNSWMKNNMSISNDGGDQTSPDDYIPDLGQYPESTIKEGNVEEYRGPDSDQKEKSVFSTVVIVLLIIIFIQVIVLGFIILRKNHFLSFYHEQGAVSMSSDGYCPYMQDSRSVCEASLCNTQDIAAYPDDLYVL